MRWIFRGEVRSRYLAKEESKAGEKKQGKKKEQYKENREEIYPDLHHTGSSSFFLSTRTIS